MEDWQQRLYTEKDELAARMGKLQNFFESETFDALSDFHQNLLFAQLGAMTSYLAILRARIQLLPEEETPDA